MISSCINGETMSGQQLGTARQGVSQAQQRPASGHHRHGASSVLLAWHANARSDGGCIAGRSRPGSLYRRLSRPQNASLVSWTVRWSHWQDGTHVGPQPGHVTSGRGRVSPGVTVGSIRPGRRQSRHSETGIRRPIEQGWNAGQLEAFRGQSMDWMRSNMAVGLVNGDELGARQARTGNRDTGQGEIAGGPRYRRRTSCVTRSELSGIIGVLCWRPRPSDGSGFERAQHQKQPAVTLTM